MLSVKAVSELLDVSNVHLKKLLKDNDYDFDRTSSNNGAIKIPSETVGKLLSSSGLSVTEKFISNFSLKGGLGKTVLNASLGHYLSLLSPNSKKILVVDMDMENCATSMLIPDDADLTDSITMYEVIKNDLKVVNHAIPTKYENLDIIPSNVRILKADRELTGKNPKKALDKYFEGIFDKYSMVIFDMSPSLSAMNTAALLKLDHLNIILNPDIFALESAFLLVDELKELTVEYDTDMPHYSVTMNRWSKARNASKDVYDALMNSDLAPRLLQEKLMESSSIVNALNEGKSIIECSNKATRNSFVDICNTICPLEKSEERLVQ
jgi:cellulose biosynthesis protein BcsQ